MIRLRIGGESAIRSPRASPGIHKTLRGLVICWKRLSGNDLRQIRRLWPQGFARPGGRSLVFASDRPLAISRAIARLRPPFGGTYGDPDRNRRISKQLSTNALRQPPAAIARRKSFPIRRPIIARLRGSRGLAEQGRINGQTRYFERDLGKAIASVPRERSGGDVPLRKPVGRTQERYSTTRISKSWHSRGMHGIVYTYTSGCQLIGTPGSGTAWRKCLILGRLRGLCCRSRQFAVDAPSR